MLIFIYQELESSVRILHFNVITLLANISFVNEINLDEPYVLIILQVSLSINMLNYFYEISLFVLKRNLTIN